MDWLTFVLQFGSTAVVVVTVAGFAGKWLMRQITAALNSYVTAYAQEGGKIDSRIERLEKLVQEQAALTRTIESIKDEIAAAGKSRDNRWEFRKDVYSNLIIATSDLISHFSPLVSKAKNDPTGIPTPEQKERLEAEFKDFSDA